MENVIKSFGTWQVTEEGIDSAEPYYDLGIYEIFETMEEDGITIWKFPVHMTEKSWMMGAEAHRLEEFNQAFKFAQDYFKARRPENTANVSDAYTWRMQQELVSARARFNS
jgi:hypothetical protein